MCLDNVNVSRHVQVFLHIFAMSRCVITMNRYGFMCLDMSKQCMSRYIFMIPMVLSMAPLHSLGYNAQNEVMLTTSSMAPFCSLGKDNESNV